MAGYRALQEQGVADLGDQDASAGVCVAERGGQELTGNGLREGNHEALITMSRGPAILANVRARACIAVEVKAGVSQTVVEKAWKMCVSHIFEMRQCSEGGRVIELTHLLFAVCDPGPCARIIQFMEYFPKRSEIAGVVVRVESDNRDSITIVANHVAMGLNDSL
jgi:hypothetical protein